MTRIGFLGEVRNALGESPVWDPRCGWLWWVDSIAGRIAAATPDGMVQRDWTFDCTVGSIGLGPDGGLVAAFAREFALVSALGAETTIAIPDIGDGPLRFNDGKADRHGRFVAGTIQTGDLPDAIGSVWRLDRDGAVTRIERGIRIANATCFSPAGDTLYLADSLEGGIRRYAYDLDTGSVGERETLIDAETLGGAPDGATVDADGRLWVALVTAQAIACVSPEGSMLDHIATPIPYPSCPVFGGADMATLYVTTIADSGHRLFTDHPDGGRILAIEGLGTTGLVETPYAPDNHKRN